LLNVGIVIRILNDLLRGGAVAIRRNGGKGARYKGRERERNKLAF
jgi:hypothetical protein